MNNKYTAMEVANYIIWFVNNKTDNRDLTPLKLQKILYYVQANYLATHNGVALFDDSIEKWQYGPVVPSVYHEFKDFGINHISVTRSMVVLTDGKFELVDFNPKEIDHSAEEDIIKVVNHLINFDPFTLVERTHKEHMWSDDQEKIMSGARGLIYDNSELTAYFQNNPII